MKPTTTFKDCRWAKDDIKRLREEEGRMLHFDPLILGECNAASVRQISTDRAIEQTSRRSGHVFGLRKAWCTDRD